MNKNLKKVLTVFVTLVLFVSFAGCSVNIDSSKKSRRNVESRHTTSFKSDRKDEEVSGAQSEYDYDYYDYEAEETSDGKSQSASCDELVVSELKWFGTNQGTVSAENGTAYYTNTNEICLSIYFTSLNVDVSGVYFTVFTPSGEVLYVSSHGDTSGVYRDTYRNIPEGQYTIMYFNGDEVIGQASCYVYEGTECPHGMFDDLSPNPNSLDVGDTYYYDIENEFFSSTSVVEFYNNTTGEVCSGWFYTGEQPVLYIESYDYNETISYTWYYVSDNSYTVVCRGTSTPEAEDPSDEYTDYNYVIPMDNNNSIQEGNYICVISDINQTTIYEISMVYVGFYESDAD